MSDPELQTITSREMYKRASTCAWGVNDASLTTPKVEVKPNRKERRKQLALARKRGRK